MPENITKDELQNAMEVFHGRGSSKEDIFKAAC